MNKRKINISHIIRNIVYSQYGSYEKHLNDKIKFRLKIVLRKCGSTKFMYLLFFIIIKITLYA